MTDINEYARLAQEGGAFKDIELEILKESLLTSIERPGLPYRSVELRDGKLLAGFGLLFRTPGADFTFDVAALCVDASYLDKGIGRKLIDLIEEEALRAEPSAIVRFEISTRKRSAAGPGLLEECGYSLIGHIADFYGKEDDYYMYARHLFRPRPPKEGEKAAEVAKLP